LSGEVDDKSALEIGKFLGAQTIVSGAISPLADRYRMRIRALNVLTSEVQGQYNRNIATSRLIAALMKGGRSEGARYSGTTYGARTARSGNTSDTTTGQSTNRQTQSTQAQTQTHLYKIGDTGPAGGLIFYDKGNNIGGWRYLEAAPADLGPTAFLTESPDSFPKNLYELWERKELAAHSGVKKRTIDSYVGTHGYTPSVKAAVSIAQALGVSVEYLVTGEDTIKGRPLSSLQSDIQEIVQVTERLSPKDRFIILNLARLIQKSYS
jgi:transcriptional regulator with XRE-family HTH domain